MSRRASTARGRCSTSSPTWPAPTSRATASRCERIAVVNGALDGIERVLAAPLAPGDAVAVEDPGWPNVFDVARALGLRLVPVAVDERGMLPDALAGALRAGARAVVITPRGHNPAGAALDAARAEELRAAWPPRCSCSRTTTSARSPARPGTRCDRGPAHPPHRTRPRGWAVVRSASKWLGPDLRRRRAWRATSSRSAASRGANRSAPAGSAASRRRSPRGCGATRRSRRSPAARRETYARRREALSAALAAHGIEAAGAQRHQPLDRGPRRGRRRPRASRRRLGGRRRRAVPARGRRPPCGSRPRRSRRPTPSEWPPRSREPCARGCEREPPNPQSRY